MKVVHRIPPLGTALAALLAVLAPWVWPAGAASPGPEVRLTLPPDGSAATVDVVHLDPQQLAELESRGLTADEWPSVFAVYTGEILPDVGAGKPPVAGTYTVEDGLLRFRPRYPLVEGLTYSARFVLRSESPLVEASFALPERRTAPTTSVTRVYPSAGEVPENLLRLYLYFSAPMSRGEAYEHVRIVDEESGAAVEWPFVEITEELWDPRMQRLTLFFDPGRIKRGLRPHLEAGPPLAAGGTYRLVVDAGWRDAQGLPLMDGFEKRFTVAAADRKSPDPGAWRVEAPRAGSRGAVTLRFEEPLDHGLLLRVLRVRDGRGAAVEGQVETSADETAWSFTPARAWQAGSYEIVIETILEDLAGNNLKNVFDVDLERPTDKTTDDDHVVLTFVAAR